MVDKLTGGCLCGCIRFEATGVPNNPHSCSCSMCQRHSGATSLIWVDYPSASVTWVGEGGAPAVYRSSDDSSRAFCPKCGSTIGAIDDKPVIGLVVGIFDNPKTKQFKPLSHSYKAKCPSWAKLPGMVATK